MGLCFLRAILLGTELLLHRIHFILIRLLGGIPTLRRHLVIKGILHAQGKIGRASCRERV